MKEHSELNQMIYSILKIQIEFGIYGYEDHLPPIEEMAELVAVSMDTVRLAYHQLQAEGYLTLSKSIGTVVTIHYTEDEIAQNIQSFFTMRKDTILDVSRSMPLLLSNIQLQAWKTTSPKELSKLGNYVNTREGLPSYFTLRYLQTVYGFLNNDLIIRLVRKMYIVYMMPFLSLKGCEKHANQEFDSLPDKLKMRSQEDWAGLRALADDGMEQCLVSIDNFYKTRITRPVPEAQIPFTWSSYKKASQFCYSVGFKILRGIVVGKYPTGSFLPSLKKLAEEKQVSVSTIRYTLSLLNDLGIVKTVNGVGTQILSMDHILENCCLSSPIVRKRLLDCRQSLQFFALSCRDVAACTISSIASENKAYWKERLNEYARLGTLDLISTFSLEYISQAAPYQTIRTVYKELYKQLFWGIPVRGMKGTQDTLNTYYLPYYHAMTDCLERSDAEGFAAKLEEVLYRELAFVTEKLAEFGIQED